MQYSVPETAGGDAVINVQVSDGWCAGLHPDPGADHPDVLPPPTFTGASMSVEKGSLASQDLAGLVGTANAEQRRR